MPKFVVLEDLNPEARIRCYSCGWEFYVDLVGEVNMVRSKNGELKEKCPKCGEIEE